MKPTLQFRMCFLLLSLLLREMLNELVINPCLQLYFSSVKLPQHDITSNFLSLVCGLLQPCVLNSLYFVLSCTIQRSITLSGVLELCSRRKMDADAQPSSMLFIMSRNNYEEQPWNHWQVSPSQSVGNF